MVEIRMCNETYINFNEMWKSLEGQILRREDDKIELVLEKHEKKFLKSGYNTDGKALGEINLSYIRTITRINENVIRENFYDCEGKLSVLGIHRKDESKKYDEYDNKLKEDLEVKIKKAA